MLSNNVLVCKVNLLLCSAGYYINAERSRNPEYCFHDYIKGLESGIQAESEKMLGRQNISCPVTMAMAISMAVHELVSDDHLRKVHSIFKWLFVGKY